MIGQNIDGIGIDDNRTLTAPDLCDHGDSRLFIGAQTRSDAHRIVIFRLDSLREDGFIAIELDNGLWHTHLHDHIVLFGGMGRHLTSTRSQTGLSSQHRGSSHTITACNDQGVAHISLVGVRITFQEQRTDVVFLYQRIVGLDLVDALLTQTDIQHLQAPDILLVLWEEERQFLLLQSQCEVGTYDVRTDIIGVVVGHQS